MKISLILTALMLFFCGCAAGHKEIWDEEKLSAALQESTIKEGIIFAEDLDDNGSAELYVIEENSDGTGSRLHGFNGDGTGLGTVSMGLAADGVWQVNHTFNEEKGYLYLESRGYACAGDGEAPYTQHYITLKRNKLNSKDVMVNNLFGGVSYVIDGKIITDHREHRKALDDYFLKDGDNEQLPYSSFTEDTIQDSVSAVYSQWQENNS